MKLTDAPKRKIAGLTFCIVVFFAAFFDSPLRAAEANFLEKGFDAYVRGDFKSALDAFARSLLADPRNADAAGYIREIKDEPSIGTEMRFKILQYFDLVDAVETFAQRREHLLAERERYFQYLLKRGISEDDFFSVYGIDLSRPKMLFESANVQYFHKQRDPLGSLINVLKAKRNFLLKGIETLEKQNTVFRSLYQHARYNPDDSLIVNRIAEKRSGKEEPSGEAPPLHQRLEELTAGIQKRDKKINELKTHLIGISLRLKEAEKAEIERLSTISQMDRELSELHSRIALNQRIIDEKNQRINDLESSLATLREEMTAWKIDLQDQISRKNDQIAELSGFLNLYKGLLKDSAGENKRTSRRLGETRRQLELVRVRLSKNSDKLALARKEVSRLKDHYLDLYKSLSGIAEKVESIPHLQKSPGSEIDDIRLEVQSFKSIIRDEVAELNDISRLLKVSEIQDIHDVKIQN